MNACTTFPRRLVPAFLPWKSIVFNQFLALSILLLFSSAGFGQLVRSAAGPGIETITPARDQFRADLGGGTAAGANGSFGGVRREINWDGVPDAFSAPNNLPANFFNVNSPRGAVFATPGSGFQVSANAGVAPVEFGNIDPSYVTLFAPFSPQKLFTALGSNVTDVNFFVPGTTTPALTRGFGAVFSDVDLANTTSIQFFDRSNVSLGTFFVPPFAGQQTFSFLGVLFPAPIVARVRITSGNTALGAGVTESLPGRDLVVMDDFLYGEPVAVCTAPTFLNNNQIVLDASCAGNDGNISLIPLSGTAPFMYSINGGATYVEGANTGRTFQGLAVGMYQLRIKDANGCESAVVQREVKLVYGVPCSTCMPPTFLNDMTIVLDATCDRADGNISIIPTSGTAPFQYSINGGTTWVPGPAAGYTFMNLQPGTYQLRLKNAVGCESAIVTRTVAEGPCGIRAPFVKGSNTAIGNDRLPGDAVQVQAYPNPSNGQFQVQLKGFGTTQKVDMQVLDAKGSVLLSRTLTTRQITTINVDLSGKAKGLYFIRVVSNYGMQVQKLMLQ